MSLSGEAIDRLSQVVSEYVRAGRVPWGRITPADAFEALFRLVQEATPSDAMTEADGARERSATLAAVRLGYIGGLAPEANAERVDEPTDQIGTFDGT